MFSQKVMFVRNPENTMQRLAGDLCFNGKPTLPPHCNCQVTHTVMFHQHNQQFIPVKLDLSLGREMLYKVPVDAS